MTARASMPPPAEEERGPGITRGRPRGLAAALTLFVGLLLAALPWLARALPGRAADDAARAAAAAYLQARQAGEEAAARRWVAPVLLRTGAWPGPDPVDGRVTGFDLAASRFDLAGRVHVPATVDLGRDGVPYAARFVQDLTWLVTPAGPRLVGLRGRLAAEVTARGDELAWRQGDRPPVPGPALAGLPARARPAGAPPGVEVPAAREGFGPLALAGDGRLLLTTTGDRPLVALAEGPGGAVRVLDVLYHSRPRLWQVAAGARHAALALEAEGGARTFLVYDLRRLEALPPVHLERFPLADYHLIPAGWDGNDLLFDALPRRPAPGLMGRPAPGAGRWRLELPSGRMSRVEPAAGRPDFGASSSPASPF